ncbi:S1C family serine protease [Ligilactobacillus faecis]|uniref:S1C family serine protease n=1 Tax=Ligilactobacillus faecis TaxID=762833 RepID=UPI0024683DD4|nr:trypsin-like peptidase domain-containing protein [Ligilactobacillus faecis]WGN90117.1 trypsin-like peptidase domain-containing protein [Ligilactobacillus faecis]
MSKDEKFDGEFKANDSMQAPQRKAPKNGLGKIVLVGLVSGLVGGGLAVGGYNYYQDHASSQLASNSQGVTSTSNVKVNVSTQTTTAFNKVKDAVVSVEAYSEQQSSSSLEELFGQSSSSSQSQTATSEGSGVIYKKSGNTAYVVTNNHVISGANKVEVLLSNGKKLSATVVGHDAVTDLAVLKISANDVKQVASFGNSDDIKVGETALAIGSPLGSEYATSLTQGIISAKSRTIDVTNSNGVTTGQATVIQTDAAINPGNSGGALVNLAGQVIGINSMKLSSSGSSSATVEGMGFAIPSNEVVSVINELVKNGKIKRPALGISLVDLDYISESARKSTLKLPTDVTSGVVVMKIEDNSPLKDSGIAKYDVITSIGGTKVTDLATLRQALYKHSIGDTVEVGYYHEGKEQKTKVKLTLEADDSNTTTSSNENSDQGE